MTEHHVTSVSQTATLVLVILMALGMRPCLGLCESRCEQSIPQLYRLRALWTRSFKRVGEQRVSFEQFLLSLVQASHSEGHMMRRLRNSLLRMIGRYQDCVMACEHQFSKRSGQERDRSSQMDALCQRLLLYQSQRSTYDTFSAMFRQFCSLRAADRFVT